MFSLSAWCWGVFVWGTHVRRGLGAASVLIFVAVAPVQAETLESHSNPVSTGSIQIDLDRSDWDSVAMYEEDPDDIDFFPVDMDFVQVAHDAEHIFLRVVSHAWETEELWRVGTYLDTDLDTTTGYNGDFLAVGADYFIEENGLFEFTGDLQSEWSWQSVTEIERDQTDLLDSEFAIPRGAMGDPEQFDFLLFANNFCCDFGEPDDEYPNGSAVVGGVFFSYEVTDPPPPDGDFNGDGRFDVGDLDALIQVISSMTHEREFDLAGDPARVDLEDLTFWVHNLGQSWIGDANLDGEFNTTDLVGVFTEGKFEQDVEATWAQGDWNADLRFGTGDLVAAFTDGGYELGPRPAAPVPEPLPGVMVIGVLLFLAENPPRRRT